MVVFPHAKINLGLRVLNKRADGFHNIETVFYPFSWQDALEAVPSDAYAFYQYGQQLAENTADNLCEHTVQLIARDFDLPPHSYCLYKAIPSGAGLGGGSSDAAFTLKLVNELAGLTLTQHQLEDYAARLGSDCPFFIGGQPVYATGRGEVMQPIDLDLSGYTIAVVVPDVKVNTDWAYSRIIPQERETSLAERLTKPIEMWQHTVTNDFEQPVIDAYPEIGRIKEKLLEKGAQFAMMSGSGSAVFGLFNRSIEGRLLADECEVERRFVWVDEL